MEKSTPVGLVLGLVLIFGTIFMGDGWETFIDLPSIVIVFGGTLAALLVAFSLGQVKGAVGGLKSIFTFKEPALDGLVAEFGELAKLVRRDGLLALDRRLHETEDDLMRFGLEMAVDGVDPDEVGDLMQVRIDESVAGSLFMVKFWNTAGTYAPAFGMVGTLIGLIQMLQNLSDPSAIGPAMAVAMITTFYGAVFANLVCLPLASKQNEQAQAFLKRADIIREGVLGIVRGENPTLITKRLRQYLGDDAAEAAEEAPTPLKQAA
ncbi:MAG TPA: MotA/TolQ/ExbB proton channel family protein [Glycomyces sp.]|nr:MotA/TolQ/ExbB proton channel family protein [Glycomyces sp.]